jgi:hypothetical protein
MSGNTKFYIVRQGCPPRVVYRGRDVERVRSFAPLGKQPSDSPVRTDVVEFHTLEEDVGIKVINDYYRRGENEWTYRELFSVHVARKDLAAYLKRRNKR